MVERTPMGRLAEVEDIAACALFLASPAADYVSGQVVGVHGGLSALNMPFPRAFD
jgi:7-alpha-hydroxysteroid dehydrogenase